MTSELSTSIDTSARLVATCDRLQQITDAGHETFVSQFTMQWAAQHGIVRLAEDIQRLPLATRERFPAQPWRSMIGMRNVIAHQYDTVDVELLWTTLTEHVPALRDYINEVMLPKLRDEQAGVS